MWPRHGQILGLYVWVYECCSIQYVSKYCSCSTDHDRQVPFGSELNLLVLLSAVFCLYLHVYRFTKNTEWGKQRTMTWDQGCCAVPFVLRMCSPLCMHACNLLAVSYLLSCATCMHSSSYLGPFHKSILQKIKRKYKIAVGSLSLAPLWPSNQSPHIAVNHHIDTYSVIMEAQSSHLKGEKRKAIWESSQST